MRTIFVTGSSRGIGKAIASLAHKQGYKVIVHGKTDDVALRKTHNELSGSLKTFFDVGDKEEVHKSLKILMKKHGAIDILVNNAGVTLNYIKDISEVNEQKALEEWKINVLGPIHCTQAVLPGMLKKKRGSIVNIASIKGYPNLATMSSFTYAQTKSAVISMTKSLAKAYSPKGIRVNAVAPGYVKTEQAKLWSKDTFKRINEGTLLARIAKPEEIAPVVMFLASDDASYVTGTVVLADGGYTLKGK